MTTINAKDYSSRSELENKVRSLVGLTPEPKSDYEIAGTRDELARLQLSDESIFWGIGCRITDTPTTLCLAPAGGVMAWERGLCLAPAGGVMAWERGRGEGARGRGGR